MIHAVISFGPRTRRVLEAEIEARIRILDMLDCDQDLEPEHLEDDGDAEPENDTWPDFHGGGAA